eukprot:CAMPEP_0171165298 /NCGR_PEP_ID=MMETSP0790-20130122/6111_1 /TAXON_ID=2925 /ORGANISM="Alexandrium catenella, Strain OF101" /LENGTH=312 /DNA_ID=CAMNT_0011630079 /DNA_START=56 /DNA_END=992 /DNA_ORIENTATION=-
MPATAGRVPMPNGNRLSVSDSLKTHDVWQKAVGYDPYAGSEDAGGSAALPEVGEINSSAKGLFRLAQLTGNSSTLAPGACKKCGQVGHLFYQCRNYMSASSKQRGGAGAELEEEEDDDPPSDVFEESQDDDDDSDSDSESDDGEEEDSDSDSDSSSSAKKKKKRKREKKSKSKKDKKDKKKKKKDKKSKGKSKKEGSEVGGQISRPAMLRVECIGQCPPTPSAWRSRRNNDARQSPTPQCLSHAWESLPLIIECHLLVRCLCVHAGTARLRACVPLDARKDGWASAGSAAGKSLWTLPSRRGSPPATCVPAA